MKRTAMLLVVLLICARSAIAEPPRKILDLLAKVEANRAAIAEKDAAIKVSREALDRDVKARESLVKAAEADREAFRAAWNDIYGDVMPAPKPDPKPEPEPAVITIPAGNLIYVGVVASVNAQTDTQATIEMSSVLAKQLTDKGNCKRWLDIDNAPTPLKPFVARAVADGLPRSMIVDWGTKTVMASEPMTDVKAAIALIKKWEGN